MESKLPKHRGSRGLAAGVLAGLALAVLPGCWRNTLGESEQPPYETVSLTALEAQPHAYLGRPVSFEARFVVTGFGQSTWGERVWYLDALDGDVTAFVEASDPLFQQLVEAQVNGGHAEIQGVVRPEVFPGASVSVEVDRIDLHWCENIWLCTVLWAAG